MGTFAHVDRGFVARGMRDLGSSRETIATQIKTAPGTRSVNCESDSQGLADADRSAN